MWSFVPKPAHLGFILNSDLKVSGSILGGILFLFTAKNDYIWGSNRLDFQHILFSERVMIRFRKLSKNSNFHENAKCAGFGTKLHIYKNFLLIYVDLITFLYLNPKIIIKIFNKNYQIGLVQKY